MPTCPDGHRTSGDEWCDECGLRLEPRPAPPAYAFGPPDGTADVRPELCPRCSTPRAGTAAFCEECRHRFGPAPAFPAPAPAHPPLSERAQSGPSRVQRPAETLPPHAAVSADSGDFLLSPPSAPGRPSSFEQSRMPPAAPPTLPAPGAPRSPTTAALGVWTAVVAPDPAYFAAMVARSEGEADGLRFPPDPPQLRIPMTENQITIGRRRSTGEPPVIDLSRAPEDPGVSHRHAVLVRRGDGGWAVIDQDSTNGTTVNGGEESIMPFHPVELTPGDRVHVGAWTTITLLLE
jgi:hypothetical protein